MILKFTLQYCPFFPKIASVTSAIDLTCTVRVQAFLGKLSSMAQHLLMLSVPHCHCRRGAEHGGMDEGAGDRPGHTGGPTDAAAPPR